MRIAQISTAHESTPPEQYDGAERTISLVTEGLLARGHEVTLFATQNSKTSAELHACFPRPIRPYSMRWELIHATEMLKRGEEFDIIHNHTEGAIPLLQFATCPALTTIHTSMAQQVPYFSYYRDCNYATLSDYHYRTFAHLPRVWVVRNGIHPDEFAFSDQKEDFLLFVGNFLEHKGADIAIEVARRLDQKLIMIARLEPTMYEFYETRIAPYIDGEQICFLADPDEERKAFFRKAKCLLFPTRGREPFGLVMTEAMASGTPVVAFDRASAPEIVYHNHTGFIVEDVEAMCAAVERVDEIDPYVCREHVVRHFSADSMVERYLEVYQEIGKREKTLG